MCPSSEGNSDDLFDCFGEIDSDDDQEIITELVSNFATVINEHRRCLVDEANSRLLSQREEKNKFPTSIVSSNPGMNNKEEEVEDDGVCCSLPDTVEMWSHRPPLYRGPMAVVVSRSLEGGGRGYVATQSCNPGTLLLVEQPLFSWPKEQIGKPLSLISVKAMMTLHSKGGSTVVRDIEHLHPTKHNVDRLFCRNQILEKRPAVTKDHRIQVQEMIREMQRLHASDPILRDILTTKEHPITNSDGSTMDEIDIWRILLVLRYNGFDSGLYLHCSMFNHDDDANCIKYVPERRNTKRGNDGTIHQRYSEVRTTKFVKRGDELSLHYLDPREVSHATRRWHLWDQHRFDIGSSFSHRRIEEMELVRGQLPDSSIRAREESGVTFRVERTLLDLEGIYKELRTLLFSYQWDNSELRGTIWERVKALEVSAQELSNEALGKLENPRQVLLIRCYRLQLNSAELLLRGNVHEKNHPHATVHNSKQGDDGVDGGEGEITDCMTRSGEEEKICRMSRFLVVARKLLELQISYYGSHHPDVARTYQDISQSINALLSNAPKQLLSLRLTDLSTFNQCSKMQDQCHLEYTRIRNFYPNDTDHLLSTIHNNKDHPPCKPRKMQ